MILENPNFLSHKIGYQETTNQFLEIARNLNKNNKTLDDEFISLNKAIESNTEEEAKMKDKNVTQHDEISDLKRDVSEKNEKLLDLKEQLRLRKMSKFFLNPDQNNNFLYILFAFYILAEQEKNEKLLRNTNMVETAIQSYFARFGLKTKIQHLEKADYKFKISVSKPKHFQLL